MTKTNSIKRFIITTVKKAPGIHSLVWRYNFLRIQLVDHKTRIEREEKLLAEIEIEKNRLVEILTRKSKDELKKNRLAIYTVITGGYDDLRIPSYTDENCDYYCFTDNKELRSDFWRIIYINDEQNWGYTRLSRYPKINPHLFFPNYTHCLYVDGKFQIQKSVFDWISLYSDGAPMLAFTHPIRDCVYEEGAVCKELQLDDASTIDSQLNRYENEGLPLHAGLNECSILYRKHNDPSVIALDQMWWKEYLANSKRDQISFGYVRWLLGFKCDICPLNCYQNNYFRCYRHN